MKMLECEYWQRSHVHWCQSIDEYPMFFVRGEFLIIDIPEDMSDQTAFGINADAEVKEFAYDEIEFCEVWSKRLTLEDVQLKMLNEIS